jgi:hypothetical protein
MDVKSQTRLFMEEKAMQPMKSFCLLNKVRIESEMVDINPNNPDWYDAYHYKVILRMGKKQMTTYFSMGYAHSNEPQVEEVINCLASDSFCTDNDTSFEEWCSSLGYDSDSRKAERIYNVCQKQAEKLKGFLGEDLYNKLLYETEGL